jgi:hypothetical protein
MEKFAQLPSKERHDILQEAASQIGLTDIILEKNFEPAGHSSDFQSVKRYGKIQIFIKISH